MKARILITGLVTALISLHASAQSNSPAGNLPPGLDKRNELPPGLQNRNQLPPGLAKRDTNDFNQTSTSSLSMSNQPGTANQSSSSNQFSAATNQNSRELTPTSDRNVTNQFENNLQTNSNTRGLNQNPSIRTTSTTMDRALTQSDRTVVLQIRQAMRGEQNSLGEAAIASSVAVLPVSFVVHNGIVEIVGTVPTLEDKQRVQTIVQRIPNITGVIDRIQVSAESTTVSANTSSTNSVAAGTSTNAAGLSSTNTLTPTSTRSTTTENAAPANTNQSGSSTNLSPTSRTNNSGLPPGLDKRDQLPPGLQNRDQLPPGLNRRTNSPGSNP
jgi:hypothetical protein